MLAFMLLPAPGGRGFANTELVNVEIKRIRNNLKKIHDRFINVNDIILNRYIA